MCGVVAVSLPSLDGVFTEPFGEVMPRALNALKLRGQSSTGIVIWQDQWLEIAKGLHDATALSFGSASFSNSPLTASAQGRYATVGNHTNDPNAGVQPIEGRLLGTNQLPMRFFVSHNGEISNFNSLLTQYGFQSSEIASDSELVARIIEEKAKQGFSSLLALVQSAVEDLEGGYTLLFQSGHDLIVARDRAGMRPGEAILLPNDGGVIIASETHAFDAILAENILQAAIPYEIKAGEIVHFREGSIFEKSIDDRAPLPEAFCGFEGTYMLHRHSRYGNGTVHEFRVRQGETIYDQFAAAYPTVISNSVIVAIPNSGLSAAEGFARQGGMELLPMILSESQFRSFQEGTEESRRNVINHKLILNPAAAQAANGKDLILIDDSIVRGLTLKEIVKRVRETCAEVKSTPQSITVISAHPVMLNPCFFGVDIKKPEDFISRVYLAAIKSTEEAENQSLADFVNVDRIFFQSVTAFRAVDQEFRGQSARLCLACSDGEYPYTTESTLHTLRLIDLAEGRFTPSHIQR